MTPEPDQSPTRSTRTAGSAAPGSRPRAGVPVWRTGKPDAVLAAAVDVARTAVNEIAPAGQVGRHLAARSEGDRLVTHLFESLLPGYPGWQWYAVLTRNSRSKVVTVDELGLLPSEDSILAPAWVPWAERVRPEDAQGEEPDGNGGTAEPGTAEHDADADEHDAAGDADADSEADNSADDNAEAESDDERDTAL